MDEASERPVASRTLRMPIEIIKAQTVSRFHRGTAKKTNALLGIVAAGLVVTAASKAARAETYYGPELNAMARQSIDVMKMHQHAMKAQLALDDAPIFLEGTMRATAATFQFLDGHRLDAGIRRAGASLGFGSGRPRTETAWFFGAQMDSVESTSFPYFIKEVDGFETRALQGALYAGFAYRGFQLSAGVVIEEPLSSVDERGFFTAPSGPPTFRPGAPSFADGAEPDVPGVRTSTFVTLTQAEGVSIGATIASLSESVAATLAALRTEIIPSLAMERANLRDKIGVPGIGLNRYAAGIDYYGDRFAELRDVANRAAAGFEPVAALANAGSDTYEIPLILEDIAETGFSLRAITQVAPKPLFRAAEASWQIRAEKARLGAKASLFRRGDALTGNTDAYAAACPYALIFSIPCEGLMQLWLTGSYSYNSPDASTFLPIPNAHVLGLQLVWGPPEMARPLIPALVRGHDEMGGDYE